MPSHLANELSNKLRIALIRKQHACFLVGGRESLNLVNQEPPSAVSDISTRGNFAKVLEPGFVEGFGPRDEGSNLGLQPHRHFVNPHSRCFTSSKVGKRPS